MKNRIIDVMNVFIDDICVYIIILGVNAIQYTYNTLTDVCEFIDKYAIVLIQSFIQRPPYAQLYYGRKSAC